MMGTRWQAGGYHGWRLDSEAVGQALVVAVAVMGAGGRGPDEEPSRTRTGALRW